MPKDYQQNETSKARLNPDALKFLRQEQVLMIDEALHAMGTFGEVRLIVEKGRLRFLVMQKSIDALKWEPGSISGEAG